MHETYFELAAAFGQGRLVEAWSELAQTQLARTWSGPALDGHVSCSQLHDAFDAQPATFGSPGFYVFGSWTGDRARIHYVGIAHRKPLKARLETRYVGKRGSHRRSPELAMAREFETEFLGVDDDFSPIAPVNLDKYRRAGIRIPHPGRHRRLFRAERWAKVGLENLWFYVIDAPGGCAKNELERLESGLVHASNALMFALARRQQLNAWPLVNVLRGPARENAYIEAAHRQPYAEWLARRGR